jgi:hypothetical protein
MKNMWKGLVIGGLTGAAAGLALDLGERGAQGVAVLGGAVAQRAPEVADHLRHSVGDAVASASDRTRSTELPAQAKATTAAAQGKVADLIADGLQRAGEAFGPAKDGLADAAGRTRDAVDHS